MFSFSYHPYIAIIGDIKESKKLQDRNAVQERLLVVLNNINKNYSAVLAAKFVITLGDEFQGLLCEGKNAIYIIEEIQREMYPVRIRFGIGMGEIKTEINPEMALGADGPAFYMARSAIEFLKLHEKKNKTYIADIRIEVDNAEKEIEECLNTIFSLLTVIKRSWTDRQREIIKDTIQYHDGQKKSAERLGITQPSVQRGLAGSDFYVYHDAIRSVNNILKKIRGKNV